MNDKNRIKILILLLLIIIISLIVILFVKHNEKKLIYKNTQKDDISKAAGVENKIDFDIKDNYFMTKLNDMYINIDTYVGKTVTYEGFAYYPETGEFVIARKYYCCGTDSYLIGLDCIYDGDKPKDNEWIKVTGEIEKGIDKDGIAYPKLLVTKLEVLNTRGEETVYN